MTNMTNTAKLTSIELINDQVELSDGKPFLSVTVAVGDNNWTFQTEVNGGSCQDSITDFNGEEQHWGDELEADHELALELALQETEKHYEAQQDKLRLLIELTGIKKPEMHNGLKEHFIYGKGVRLAAAEACVSSHSALANAAKRLKEVNETAMKLHPLKGIEFSK